MGEIILYGRYQKGKSVEVRVEGNSVWLTQKQMGELFEIGTQTINKHIKNIYNSNELVRKSTIANFAIVQIEGDRKITRNVHFYNLDMIISVGYRVNSKKGTQFRIWANRVLKDHLIKGYSINEDRLKKQEAKIRDLQKAVDVVASFATRRKLESDEATAVIRILKDYTYALDLLDQYDYGRLEVNRVTRKKGFRFTYEIGRRVVLTLKREFEGSSLFGKEKDKSFESSIETIYQTFGGVDLYRSIEEKAAHLLYFIVKNHSFVDGNKRIAAFLFLWFLEKNSILYKQDGSRILENNTLVALTLMIAESRTQDKEVIAKLVINLINQKN